MGCGAHRRPPASVGFVILGLAFSACGGAGPASALRPDRGDAGAPSDRLTVACTPDPLDFGQVELGRTVERAVRCRNDGDVRVTGVARLDVHGAGSDFSLAPSAPTFEIPARSARAVVAVRHTPRALGDDEAELRIRLSASGNAEDARIVIPVLGTGGGADIEVTPAQLNFGLVSPLAPARRSLVVTNTGFLPLEVFGLRFEPELAAFSLLDPDPFVLGPGEARALAIEFDGDGEGPSETRLVLRSTDFDEPVLEVLVRADGIGRPACPLTLVPERLDFGVVAVGETRTRAVTVTSDAERAGCLVSRLAVSDDADPAFSLVVPDPEPTLLAPNERIAVEVRVAPDRPGRFVGALELAISDPTTPFYRVPLTVTATVD